MEKWFCYNYAARCFHTKKHIAEFIRFNLIFIHKNDTFTFLGLRGNVRTLSIARWKCVVNFLFMIIELFSLVLTVETL